MAARKRVYTISMSERGGEPDARFFYDIPAADAVAAIRKARRKAAEDYCLDLRDIVVDDASLDSDFADEYWLAVGGAGSAGSREA